MRLRQYQNAGQKEINKHTQQGEEGNVVTHLNLCLLILACLLFGFMIAKSTPSPSSLWYDFSCKYISFTIILRLLILKGVVASEYFLFSSRNICSTHILVLLHFFEHVRKVLKIWWVSYELEIPFASFFVPSSFGLSYDGIF